MNAVTPVKLTLPDGVERELRFTLGAKKRIVDTLGMQLKDALNKYDAGAFPAILHALMHDEEGKPPSVSVTWLECHLTDEQTPEIMAAIMSAASQGKASKNELEARLREAMTGQTNQPTGSTSSASEPSASDSADKSSGGDTLSARSPQE
jgi:hypothetical protein